MRECKRRLTILKKILLRIYASLVRRKTFKYIEFTKGWKISNYIEYLEEIFNKTILGFKWNKAWKKKLGEFNYSQLSEMKISKNWPSVRPARVITTSVTTGTLRRKRIYYTKFDVERLWLVGLKYAILLEGLPINTGLIVSSGFDPNCLPFTSTLLGENAGYFYKFRSLHLIYSEISNERIARFVGKYGPFDGVFIFVTYLYRFLNIVDVPNIVHERTTYVHIGDVLTHNVFSAIKELFQRSNVKRFRLSNTYGASEGGLLGTNLMTISSWDPKIQNMILVPDSALYTFREFDPKTGQLCDKIYLIDEIKEGHYYNLYITPLRSVFVPNYDLEDIVYIVKKTPSEIIIRVVGRFGVPVEIELDGEVIKAKETGVIKMSGLSVISDKLLEKCGSQGIGKCIIIVDNDKKLIRIYSERKLNIVQFLRACREDSHTSSLNTALELGYQLENIHGDEAKRVLDKYFNQLRKKYGVLVVTRNQ